MSLNGNATAKKRLQGRIKNIDVIYKDAYRIAVENGFEGTITEWLASLKGDPAPKTPNPDWNQDNPDSADYIRNKPDIGGMIADQIDDKTSSPSKTWSSKMIDNQIEAAAKDLINSAKTYTDTKVGGIIDDNSTAVDKTWSSSRTYGTILENRTYANKYTDNKVAEVINDTTVSDKAWSSKNTVDELCPSFTESGVTVVCEPLEGYPLTVISYIGQDGASKITLRQDNNEESLDYTVDLPYSISDASYNWTTGTLLTADDEVIQLEPHVITALYGENTFYSDCGNTTVIGKVDPNKYWAEKLAEQEAIIAEHEAELAKLNKQYELIEDVTLTEAVAAFNRNADPDGVAYNFSKLKIVVNFAAAASNTQAIFCGKDANNEYIFYQTSANGSIGTVARKSVVTVYNDGGLVNYNALCAVNTTQMAYYAFPSYCGREWRNIATLRITTYPSSDTGIPAGTTIKIYGIRG